MCKKDNEYVVLSEKIDGASKSMKRIEKKWSPR